jgi:hypothetical protein
MRSAAFRVPLLVATAAFLPCTTTLAQKTEQIVKPPKVVLWMDVSTGNMAGMPDFEMPEMGGLVGGIMGAIGRGNADAKNTSKAYYGSARTFHSMPPRILDVALWNGLKPGVEASQRIPAGMNLGEALPLLPVIESNLPGKAGDDSPLRDAPTEIQQPKGRMLFYWGCSTTVRPGQPRILDFSKMNSESAKAFGSAFGGRYVPDRGAKVRAGYDVFPNERDQRNLPKGASLVGEHKVNGENIPESMRFTLGAMHDVMPPIDLQSKGTLKDSIALTWASVPYSKAYFLNAMAMQGDDMIFWSSSDIADAGFELMGYLSNANIDKWVKEKVLLDATATRCAIPQGIFAAKAGGQGSDRESGAAFMRMMAYGGEHGFVHPPRPTDIKIPWEQEWFVRLRIKAQTMAMLGVDMGDESGAERKGSRNARKSETQAEAAKPETAGQSDNKSELEKQLPGAVNLLKGLFGR